MEEQDYGVAGQASFLSMTDHLSDKMVKWVFIAGAALGFTVPMTLWKIVDLIRWSFH